MGMTSSSYRKALQAELRKVGWTSAGLKRFDDVVSGLALGGEAVGLEPAQVAAWIVEMSSAVPAERSTSDRRTHAGRG